MNGESTDTCSIKGNSSMAVQDTHSDITSIPSTTTATTGTSATTTTTATIRPYLKSHSINPLQDLQNCFDFYLKNITTTNVSNTNGTEVRLSVDPDLDQFLLTTVDIALRICQSMCTNDIAGNPNRHQSAASCLKIIHDLCIKKIR